MNSQPFRSVHDLPCVLGEDAVDEEMQADKEMLIHVNKTKCEFVFWIFWPLNFRFDLDVQNPSQNAAQLQHLADDDRDHCDFPMREFGSKSSCASAVCVMIRNLRPGLEVYENDDILTLIIVKCILILLIATIESALRVGQFGSILLL